MRADSLSLYGGRAEVPNLEKLARRSIVFSQAISHFPETVLSHWSMMSGVLPEVHGNVPGNGGSIYKGPTMAEMVKRWLCDRSYYRWNYDDRPSKWFQTRIRCI